jgi:protein KTI12
MLLVVLCGYPASGKSLIAGEVARLCASRGLKVELICDGAVHASSHASAGAAAPAQRRASLYADSAAEKATRARLMAAAERALAPRTAVIVDSLNYIKGFRYELFCVAKTACARFLVVHADTDADVCARQDALRDDAYGASLVAALVRRFEPPESRNRWDSPLHVVRMHAPAAPGGREFAPPSGAPGAAPPPPGWREQVAAVVEASLSRSAPLRGSFATQAQRPAGADVLSELDRATRVAEAALVSALQAGAGAGDRLDVPGASRPLVLSRRCKVAELRGMRRAHLNLARLRPPAHTAERALVDAYVDYVSAQLRES